MATRPLFSGNYGGPIGSTAQAAQFIANAGAIQGQALASLGQAGAAAIEKFQLNKDEKRKKKSRYEIALRFGRQMGVSQDAGELDAWAKAVSEDESTFNNALQAIQAQTSKDRYDALKAESEARLALMENQAADREAAKRAASLSLAKPTAEVTRQVPASVADAGKKVANRFMDAAKPVGRALQSIASVAGRLAPEKRNPMEGEMPGRMATGERFKLSEDYVPPGPIGAFPGTPFERRVLPAGTEVEVTRSQAPFGSEQELRELNSFLDATSPEASQEVNPFLRPGSNPDPNPPLMKFREVVPENQGSMRRTLERFASSPGLEPLEVETREITREVDSAGPSPMQQKFPAAASYIARAVEADIPALAIETEAAKIQAAEDARNARNLEMLTPRLTPGQEARDREAAKDFSAFIEGGGLADVEKNLEQLDEAIKDLEKDGNDNISGPVVGSIPKFAQDRANPKATAVQEAIEEVVQRNLRLILGAAFTEKEGELVIARAYNRALSEKENAKRARRIYDQIREAANAKVAALEHFNTYGTMAGFTGPTPSVQITGDSDEEQGLASEDLTAELERKRKLLEQRNRQ